jgi:putative acetyltransferase
MTNDDIAVTLDRPDREDVRVLLDEHLTDMFATSPAESVHALGHDALLDPSITFWSARDAHGRLLGCGALRLLDERNAEVKSMRTAASARGKGVAARVLAAIVEAARARGVERLWLETGAEDYFAAARRLYARHGFVECPPFGEYVPDRHSVFMTRDVRDAHGDADGPPRGGRERTP